MKNIYLFRFFLSSFITLIGAISFLGQGVSPQNSMSDSFSMHAYSSIYPATAFWGARWQKGALTSCSAANQVTINYNQTAGQLQISPSANSNEKRFNGFVSKWKMDFQNSYAQVEVPNAANQAGLITALSVGVDCNNWYQILRRGNVLQFQTKTNGGVIETVASVNYNHSAQQFWRIRHNPTTNKIIFETGEISTNIVNDSEREKNLLWTQRAETSVNFSLAQSRFEIGGGTDSAVSNPALIKFDNFLFDSNDPEPEGPQRRVDTNYPNNASGAVINVSNCNALQAAFNNAQPGDTVNIATSLACVGNFVLPVKSNPNNKWIIVRSASSAFDNNGMLKAGKRVDGENQAHRQQMPKLYTNSRQPALELPEGANYYRIVGLEFGIAPNFSLPTGNDVYSLLYMMNSATQVHHITVDRCYFRGELTPHKEIRRAIALNGSYLAVIDSYLSKLIDRAGWQNQAIGLWSGTGPIKIENNYLEALAQNILLGGDSSSTPESTITDIEIRRNYFFKSPELYAAYPGDLPPSNGIEVKQGRRIQISENVFENSKGNGIYIKSVAEESCIFCTSEDIYIKNNKFINTKGSVFIHGAEIGSGNKFPQTPGRITVENNLSYFTSADFYNESIGIGARDDVPNVRIIHNTYEADKAFFGSYVSPNMFNFEMRDNLTERGAYGLGGYEGTRSLNENMFPYDFRRNVVVNNSRRTDQAISDETLAAIYPCSSMVGNCPDIGIKVASGWDSADQSGDQVKFATSSLTARRSSGNYCLSSNSPYKNAATDGKDIGADLNALEAATRGAISGIWTNSNSKTLFDYDGDGKADVSVFRPSDRNWYLNRSRDGFAAINFGISTDIVAPGDFDGDNKTDIAVFRPLNGFWYILNSSNGAVTIVQFGLSGDMPVQADYDGDGKTDIAVFRPANGAWYSLRSSDNSFSAIQFGTNGDKPAVGDYDGDGKADLAVYRPSNHFWYIFNSQDARISYVNFGLENDKVVAADYDGDGKTDIAVFRPADGVWYSLRSSDNSFSAIQFGISSDTPSPADYDGDGKADRAVFRSANGAWYILKSGDSLMSATGFGLNEDKPTPATYSR